MSACVCSVPTWSHAVITARRTLAMTELTGNSKARIYGESRQTRRAWSDDLAQQPRRHVVDRAPDLTGQQVGALLNQPDRLPDVVVDVGERTGRPWWTAAGGLLDDVGEGDVVGRLQP